MSDRELLREVGRLLKDPLPLGGDLSTVGFEYNQKLVEDYFKDLLQKDPKMGERLRCLISR